MRRHRPIMNAMKNVTEEQIGAGCIGNPSVTPIAGPPAPVRSPVMHPWSPYWQAGAAMAFGRTQCPPGMFMGSDRNCYPMGYGMPVQNPQRPRNQPHSEGGGFTIRGEKKSVIDHLSDALNPMSSPLMRALGAARKTNPADCSDASTPGAPRSFFQRLKDRLVR